MRDPGVRREDLAPDRITKRGNEPGRLRRAGREHRGLTEGAGGLVVRRAGQRLGRRPNGRRYPEHRSGGGGGSVSRTFGHPEREWQGDEKEPEEAPKVHRNEA
jgi:hypothetical protein